ncbi:MAG: FAD-dependent oxidoreductase [Gammaproteobacteria bacterium]|nr:FAD-dependent oxidoreductase [Gammaproteobacteria bacterium]MCP5136504.1 FAD-dependent oxidoreductase [Gammaproteobacteria bacterium]
MIVIIGTGLAGYTLAREFRKLDPDTPLTLITADDGRSYSKPMLSNGLAKQKTPDQLAMADASRMAAQLNATLLTDTRVETIDTVGHRLVANGEVIEYRKLVLAVGASPIRLPLKGDGADDVLHVNDLTNYAVFRARLEGKKRVAIIGAGLIGCEFANDLVSSGYQAVVMGLGDTPLDTLIPAAAGADVKAGLAEAGVEFRLGASAQMVEKHGNAYRVVLDKGEAVDADLVLSAIGLRPDVRLAQAAGITVNRGIVTNANLQTSATDVYALGDCAEVEGVVRLYVMPIMQGARALAKTLVGETTAASYPVMPVVIKTPARPVVVVPGEGEWTCAATDAGVRCECRDGESLTGFCLTGDAVSEKQALTAAMTQA